MDAPLLTLVRLVGVEMVYNLPARYRPIINGVLLLRKDVCSAASSVAAPASNMEGRIAGDIALRAMVTRRMSLASLSVSDAIAASRSKRQALVSWIFALRDAQQPIMMPRTSCALKGPAAHPATRVRRARSRTGPRARFRPPPAVLQVRSASPLPLGISQAVGGAGGPRP